MNPARPSEHGRDILPHRPVKGERPASRGLLSIVIPCHNEEDVIESTHQRLVAALPSTGMDFEILYIDDGSRDGTLSRLEAIAAGDPRATVIELSRNFGQQSAMSAGLSQARGDAVVIIDADLQDPPEVIPEMVECWRSGADVAYGRRRSREGETWFKLVTASCFHRFFASLVPYPIPVDTGDFKLLDRAVVDAVCGLPEKRRYLRSLVAWTGFRQEPVWYDRHARSAGETKYSTRKLIRLALDAVMLSSDTPLRAAWWGAGFLTTLAVGGALLACLMPAGNGTLVATITAVIALVGAIQTTAVALVGEYVIRTYREVQGRPSWVVKKTIGGHAGSEAGHAGHEDRSGARAA
ncbi:MAG: glycosyltransferase family 2 protein [Planctomycetota bacterium]|nr:glycosyltransferase family 2 protein [Planctomycetota bacterium]